MAKTPKQQYLEDYDREHERTMRVIRAYPADKSELRPHPKSKTARELVWIFTLERGLGTKIWNDGFGPQAPAGGNMPKTPETWDEVVGALDKSSQDFRTMIAAASDEEWMKEVHFFKGPKQMAADTRLNWLWFLLFDQIHHRGQLSVYLRMADAKVPSIYGPSGDEQWF